MGALFYLPLFYGFGLNPLPYRLVAFCVLAINLWMVYRSAESLGASRQVVWIASLVMAYHAALAELFYRTSTIYDILCFFFYLSALTYYIRIRTANRDLGTRQIVVFVLLMVGALNSKEMAVTLPFVILAWEAFYRPPCSWRNYSAISWLWRQNGTALIGFAINAIYILGHKYGSDPLMKMEAYRPVITFGRAITFHRNALAELNYQADPLSPIALAALAIVLTYAAWRRPRPDLRFYWCWILLTVLPIEFLQGRTQFCLYLPLVGWALFAASIFVDLTAAASHCLSKEPLFRRLQCGHIQTALLLIGVIALAAATIQQKRSVVAPRLAAHGSRNWSIIQQLKALALRPRPGDRMIFLNDPYEGWDMLFIAQLTFRQPSLKIWLQNKSALPAAEIAAMDHILSFENSKLILVK